MEFESPDVERDFPGLYASDAGSKRSNESDFSDENHEKHLKKDLLIGKRKEKKDRGYATLEGESSPEDEVDVKSPSKIKITKPFKFSSKKEKREKSRDKDPSKEKDKEEKEKEKEKKKEKDKDEKDKDKKKDVKVKLKIKEKKKEKKGSDENIVFSEDLPIFGVPLSVATERSKCHDGVDIPLVIRNCIDHIQEKGLHAENVYKVSGIKSRVQQVRRMYNNHELVKMEDFDLPISTSLLKQFLRELPEPVLTTELVDKFETAVVPKDSSEVLKKLKDLISHLPSCNRALLGWMFVHFNQIAAYEKYNKMSPQALASTLASLLQMSPRLFLSILNDVSLLFPDIKLSKYVPPLTSVSPGLPETHEALAIELSKQESLLAQLHREMAQGLTGQHRVDQLWSVQRTVTHLKRVLRNMEKSSGQKGCDETPDRGLRSLPVQTHLTVHAAAIEPPKSLPPEMRSFPPADDKLSTGSLHERAFSTFQGISDENDFWIAPCNLTREQKSATIGCNRGRGPMPTDCTNPWLKRDDDSSICHKTVSTAESLEVQDINRESTERDERKQRAVFETEELMAVIGGLTSECEEERLEIRKIREKIVSFGRDPDAWDELCSGSSDEEESSPPPGLEQNPLWAKNRELKLETMNLTQQKSSLIENIIKEQDACVDLRVKIKMLELSRNV